MTPQFREMIFNLPLDDPPEGSEKKKWDISAKKFEILWTIQNIFAQLQESKTRATDTQSLTKSFGWENNEAMQQHDVHELNRILFEALETALSGTDYDACI